MLQRILRDQRLKSKKVPSSESDDKMRELINHVLPCRGQLLDLDY
jgi:hypothetical protein